MANNLEVALYLITLIFLVTAIGLSMNDNHEDDEHQKVKKLVVDDGGVLNVGGQITAYSTCTAILQVDGNQTANSDFIFSGLQPPGTMISDIMFILDQNVDFKVQGAPGESFTADILAGANNTTILGTTMTLARNGAAGTQVAYARNTVYRPIVNGVSNPMNGANARAPMVALRNGESYYSGTLENTKFSPGSVDDGGGNPMFVPPVLAASAAHPSNAAAGRKLTFRLNARNDAEYRARIVDDAGTTDAATQNPVNMRVIIKYTSSTDNISAFSN